MPPDVSRAWDSYFYPGTDVLKNIPGLRNEQALRAFDYEQSAARIAELREAPAMGKFDLQQLQEIHRYVFQDVYEWAGQLRTVDIAKVNSQFGRPEFIAGEAGRMTQRLAKENYLRGLDKAAFVDRFAEHYGDWNALHPFREGNGRATREFMAQLARQAGYDLDNSKIDNSKDQWNKACADSMRGDMAGLKRVFMQAVRPSRAIAFEQLSEAEALRRHPELRDAYAVLHGVRETYKAKYPGNEKAQAHFVKQAHSEIVRRLDNGKVLDRPARAQVATTRSPDVDRGR